MGNLKQIQLQKGLVLSFVLFNLNNLIWAVAPTRILKKPTLANWFSHTNIYATWILYVGRKGIKILWGLSLIRKIMTTSKSQKHDKIIKHTTLWLHLKYFWSHSKKALLTRKSVPERKWILPKRYIK